MDDELESEAVQSQAIGKLATDLRSARSEVALLQQALTMERERFQELVRVISQQRNKYADEVATLTVENTACKVHINHMTIALGDLEQLNNSLQHRLDAQVVEKAEANRHVILDFPDRKKPNDVSDGV